MVYIMLVLLQIGQILSAMPPVNNAPRYGRRKYNNKTRKSSGIHMGIIDNERKSPSKKDKDDRPTLPTRKGPMEDPSIEDIPVTEQPQPQDTPPEKISNHISKDDLNNHPSNQKILRRKDSIDADAQSPDEENPGEETTPTLKTEIQKSNPIENSAKKADDKNFDEKLMLDPDPGIVSDEKSGTDPSIQATTMMISLSQSIKISEYQNISSTTSITKSSEPRTQDETSISVMTSTATSTYDSLTSRSTISQATSSINRIDLSQQSIDTRPYVASQDPLNVFDTSLVVLNKFEAIVGEKPAIAEIIDRSILVTALKTIEQDHERLIHQQDDGNHPPTISKNQGQPRTDSGQWSPPQVQHMNLVNGNGEPLLYPGVESSRTARNCYIVQLSIEMDAEAHAGVLEILKLYGGVAKDQYGTADGIHGFSVCFPDGILPLTMMRAIRGVRWVERDQYSRSSQISTEDDSSAIHALQHLLTVKKESESEASLKPKYTQIDAPWQLSRINNPKSGFSDSYKFSATGKGVTVYVIDSGVLSSHGEFGDRAKLGFSVFSSGFPTDCSGHGTQVASVVAGTNVGVAKSAKIIGVQILDCAGQGENSSVIAALNWIIATHTKPAVINMSVGGAKSISIDAAVSKAVARGIPVVVAGGNGNEDACQLSPSGVPASLAVGASTPDNMRAEFSNYGGCIDVFAPGRFVVTAAIPSQAVHNGFTFVSGTSLSAPMVSGIYAMILERLPGASPEDLRKLLLAAASQGSLGERTLRGSRNLLAQVVPISVPDSEESLTFMYLPRGSLPVLGATTSAVSILEIVLVALAGICGCIVGVLVLLVLVRRRTRKREELALRDVPSVFQ
jgi:hypothetical protein